MNGGRKWSEEAVYGRGRNGEERGREIGAIHETRNIVKGRERDREREKKIKCTGQGENENEKECRKLKTCDGGSKCMKGGERASDRSMQKAKAVSERQGRRDYMTGGWMESGRE